MEMNAVLCLVEYFHSNEDVLMPDSFLFVSTTARESYLKFADKVVHACESARPLTIAELFRTNAYIPSWRV